MMIQPEAEVLPFFRAVADATRLRVIGLLALKTHSSAELAAALKLKPAQLARHLKHLIDADLIRPTEDRQLALRLEAVHTLAARVLAQAQPSVPHDRDESDREVLRHFLLPSGALRDLPAHEKKLLTVLRYLRDQFEPKRLYSEKEVNSLLARFHADTASLRRYLVDFQFMAREKGQYWRNDGGPRTEDGSRTD